MAKTEEIKVIFEDDKLLVLAKPAGVVTTNENRTKNTGSVEDWLAKNFPNKLPRQGIVHRLDKGTSGLLLAARDEESLLRLKKQFGNREVVKRYAALASGDLPQTGSVVMPIGRSRAFGKFRVDETGKRAVTEFQVIQKYRINGRIYSLVDVDLKTGRTHQIRVHFNYLGWPLLGDKVYGGIELPELNRPFLHAKYIRFVHPADGREMKFESPLPKDLTNVIENVEIY